MGKLRLYKQLIKENEKNPGNGILFDFFVNNSVICRKIMVYLLHILTGFPKKDSENFRKAILVCSKKQKKNILQPKNNRNITK